MISPELVRRYAFFSNLSDQQIKAVAMLGDEWAATTGEEIFEDGQPAAWLHLLVQGSVDLFLVIESAAPAGTRQEHFIGEVSPGEVFGISGLLAPFVYTLTARAAGPCRLVRFEAAGLRNLAENEPVFAAQLYRQAAHLAMGRLHDTRVRLAAAWARKAEPEPVADAGP